MQINLINQTCNQNFGIELSDKLAKTLSNLQEQKLQTGTKGVYTIFADRIRQLNQLCPGMRLEQWDKYIVALDKDHHHAQIVFDKPLDDFPVRLKQLVSKLRKLDIHNKR